MAGKAWVAGVVAVLLAGCSDDRVLVVSDTCSIDVPAKDGSFKAGDPLHVAGWAFDRASGTVPKDVFVQVNSADHTVVRRFAATRGTRRDDVARAMGVPAAVWSGFDTLVPTADLPAGRYQLQVLQTAERKVTACAVMHFVTLSR